MAEREILQSIGVATETGFGIRNNPTSFLPCPAFVAPLTWAKREEIADESAKTDRGAYPPIVGAKNRQTLPLSVYAVGLQVAAGNGVLATQRVEGRLLKAAVGEETLTTGDLTDAAPGTATVVNLDGAAAMSADTFAGFTTPNNGVRWRPIESIATVAGKDQLTLVYGLPEACAAGAIVYGSATYRVRLEVDDDNSVQVQIKTEKSTRGQWEAYGCKARTMRLEQVRPREVARLAFDLNLTDWDDSQTDASLTPITLPSKAPWVDSQLEIWEYATSPVAYAAGNRRSVLGSFMLGVDNAFEPDTNPNSVGGISGYLTGPGPALTCTLSMRVDQYWRDAFDAGTKFSMIATWGRTAGRTFGCFVRRMHLSKDPAPAPEAGQMAQPLEFTLDTGIDAAATPAALFFMG